MLKKKSLILLVFLLVLPIVDSGLDFQCEDGTLFGSCNEKGEICAGGENLIYDDNVNLDPGEYLFFGFIEGACYQDLYDLYVGDLKFPLTVTKSGKEKKVVSEFVVDPYFSEYSSGDLNVKCRVLGSGWDVDLTKKYFGRVSDDAGLYDDCDYCGKCEGEEDSISKDEMCPDFNGDNKVNFEDFFLLSDIFGKNKDDKFYNKNFDLDEDGSIGLDDFFKFASDFGKECNGLDDGSCYFASMDFNTPQCLGRYQIPSNGNSSILIIMVDFLDSPDMSGEIESSWSNFFQNEEDKNTFNNYWNVNSFGKFNPDTSFFRINLDKYFGDYCSSSNREECSYFHDFAGLNLHELLRDSLEQIAEDGIDLNGFDMNGRDGMEDGWLDGVILILNKDFRAHASGNFEPVEVENKLVGNVGLVNLGLENKPMDYPLELHLEDKRRQVLHEFGHLLGFKDYYNLDAGSEGSMRFVSLMSASAFENHVIRFLDAYSRYIIGWSEIQLASTDSEFVFSNDVPNSNVLKIEKDEDEYLLLEYRKANDFYDDFFKNGGVALYHVYEKGIPTFVYPYIHETYFPRIFLISAQNSQCIENPEGELFYETKFDYGSFSTQCIVGYSGGFNPAYWYDGSPMNLQLEFKRLIDGKIKVNISQTSDMKNLNDLDIIAVTAETIYENEPAHITIYGRNLLKLKFIFVNNVEVDIDGTTKFFNNRLSFNMPNSVELIEEALNTISLSVVDRDGKNTLYSFDMFVPKKFDEPKKLK